MFVVTKNGQKELLNNAISQTLANADFYTVKLFTNDYQPDASTTSSDFDEADFDGYLPVSVLREDWDAANYVSSITSTTLSYPVVFNSTDSDPQTIYGYWIEGGLSGDCLWAEYWGPPYFAGPVTMAPSGQIQVTLVFRLVDQGYYS